MSRFALKCLIEGKEKIISSSKNHRLLIKLAMKYFEWKIRGRCAWIWVRQMDSAHQQSLPDVLTELEEVLVKIEGEKDIEAVVFSIRRQDFIGGVGLEFLLGIKELGIWENYGRIKQQLFQRIKDFFKAHGCSGGRKLYGNGAVIGIGL